jgi:hypothetical protein
MPTWLFHPTNEEVTRMLEPLAELVKKACYVSNKSRAIGLIAKKMIERDNNKNKSIQVKYL